MKFKTKIRLAVAAVTVVALDSRDFAAALIKVGDEGRGR